MFSSQMVAILVLRPRAVGQRITRKVGNDALMISREGLGRGQLVFRATEIARTMIIAIVTSREAEPGKSKWLTNNDLAKSSSCRISQTIRNMAMKKQKIHGILLIYCPKSTIYFKKQTSQGTKTRRF